MENHNLQERNECHECAFTRYWSNPSKKIDEIPKEKKFSRQEFLKGQVATLAVFREQKNREVELERLIDRNIKMM